MESNKSSVKESNSFADKGLAAIVANKEKLWIRTDNAI